MKNRKKKSKFGSPDKEPSCPNLRLRLRIWTAPLCVGTRSLLWNGSPNRGILARIGRRYFVFVNNLRVVVVSSYSCEIGFRNILGPDTSISTHVLPEGQCKKESPVAHHCYVPRRNKNVSFFAILENGRLT